MTASTTPRYELPAIAINIGHRKNEGKPDTLGMRKMQQRVWAERDAQYLLIKSPPASGKSRALMFIALDKLNTQGLKQVIIAVPERSIGSSFANEALRKHGFFWDWEVAPQWNLCNAPGEDDQRVDSSKINAVGQFLKGTHRVLVCTHATFRFAVERFGIEAFDNRLIAIDEFHHVSSNENNKLGTHLTALIERNRVHMVAMTGSYFRGDSEAVLAPRDEEKFRTVSYTYLDQLQDYQHLKTLKIGHWFYSGEYVKAIKDVLDTNLKTIIHIPNVNSRESLGDKEHEVNQIISAMGAWEGTDDHTGFHLVRRPDGTLLKVADLVDDRDLNQRSRVLAALKDPEQKDNPDHVDIIIALGMAKEGFDWKWCQHALTIGYRSSLTEIVQIIGRATRDAKGKTSARFTNMISEPSLDQQLVAEAINDTLKAISGSLLMEQVLAPHYELTPKNAGSQAGYNYGQNGYQPQSCNLGVHEPTGRYHVEINGLAKPSSPEAQRVCKEDLKDLIATVLQNRDALRRALFDQANTLPQEVNQVIVGRIVKDKYPNFSDEDQEAIRQHAVAAINLTQRLGKLDQAQRNASVASDIDTASSMEADTRLINGAKKYINVRDLDIDLIDRIRRGGELDMDAIDGTMPHSMAYAILAKSLNDDTLRQIQQHFAKQKISIPEDEARELARHALFFKKKHNRLPDLKSSDPWEQRMAQGVQVLARIRAKAKTQPVMEPAHV